MYLPQRDDVPLCRAKAVQSGVASEPREKERQAMREERFEGLDSVNLQEGKATNSGEVADKVHDCPVQLLSPVVVYSLKFFFPTRSQSVFLSLPLRSAFPLRAEPEAGSPGESRAMTK